MSVRSQGYDLVPSDRPSVCGVFSTALALTRAVIQVQAAFTALLSGPSKRQPHRMRQGRTTFSSARSQTNSRKRPAVSSWSATLPAQISLIQQTSWLFLSNWTSLQSLTHTRSRPQRESAIQQTHVEAIQLAVWTRMPLSHQPSVSLPLTSIIGEAKWYVPPENIWEMSCLL